MPLYDYRCAECGTEVEVMHPIDGRGPATCEACGGAMRKALSTPAIHFKGSGWAKKDAAASAKKAKADSDASPAAPSKDETGGKASSTATETKAGAEATPAAPAASTSTKSTSD